MPPMKPNFRLDRPRVFMLRLWAEDLELTQLEWRGKVQSLPDGETYYFRSWDGLIAHLQTMLDPGGSGDTGLEPKKGREV